MFRALTILADVVALAFSPAPASAVTSAGTSTGKVRGKMHLDDVSVGIITDKSAPKLLAAA